MSVRILIVVCQKVCPRDKCPDLLSKACLDGGDINTDRREGERKRSKREKGGEKKSITNYD